jgi:hypothetical protein
VSSHGVLQLAPPRRVLHRHIPTVRMPISWLQAGQRSSLGEEFFKVPPPSHPPTLPQMTALAPVLPRILALVLFVASVEALNSNLKFFSVWELESVQPKDALGWSNFLFTSGNVSQLKEWSEAGIGPSLLYVYDVFFRDGTLRPDYQASWTQTFSILEPLLKSKAAMGVFLGDELAWSCIPFSNISAAADLVRLSIPRGTGIIYYNEAFPPFVPDGQAIWREACPNVLPLTYPRQVELGYPVVKMG